MSNIVSRLKKIALAKGVDPYGTEAISFTRGILASAFSANSKIDIKGVPEVRGDFTTRRATTNSGKDIDVSLSFPLDCGDNASGDIGYFLLALMGKDTVTGAGPYTHKFERLDSATPPWLNLWSDKDIGPKQYAGFRPSSIKFTLKAGEGLINTEVTGVAQEEYDLSNPLVVVFSGSPVLTPQAAQLAIGSSTPCFDELTITLTRDLQRYRCIGESKTIKEAFTKAFQITIEGKGIGFEDEATRDIFLAGTADTFTLRLTDALSHYLEFDFPAVKYTAFTGPDIKDTELLMVNLNGMVMDDAYHIDLVNTHAADYEA